MNIVNATVTAFSRTATPPSSTPAPGTAPEKSAQDCVKRYPVNQFSLRNLHRGYA
jgi:hypothetical protein